MMAGGQSFGGWGAVVSPDGPATQNAACRNPFRRLITSIGDQADRTLLSVILLRVCRKAWMEMSCSYMEATS